MTRTFTTRTLFALLTAAALCLTSCRNNGSTSTPTTSPSPTPADATMNEAFSAIVPVGGEVFYSFTFVQYGNTAITLTGVTGAELPEDLTIGLAIGRPSGTSCAASSSVSAAPGEAAQLTGAYGPGVYCIRLFDMGTLTTPVRVTATVAHS